MGLYLCVFEGDEELEGVEVGSYADWGRFVEAVVALEGGRRGARFPLITLHPDSDGQWSPDDAITLAAQLGEIEAALKKAPPAPPAGGWQAAVAKQLGLRFASLYDCFFDVDGEPLVERLGALAREAAVRRLPILFQ